jgi:transcriptional regulator with XRE-family HTH domain
MRTVDYLNQVRALTPTGSVYAAAALLGLPEGTVRNWHLGERFPDALACAKIAELLDLPLELVIADVELEREKNPERRAYWEALARKFAACAVMGLAITTWPNNGHSAFVAPATQANAFDLLQIMRRTLRRVGLWLRGFGRFPGFAS